MNKPLSQRHDYNAPPHLYAHVDAPGDTQEHVHIPKKRTWKRALIGLFIVAFLVAAAVIVPKYWDIWSQNIFPAIAVVTRSPQPTQNASTPSPPATPSPSVSAAAALKTTAPPTPTPVLNISDDWNYVDSDIEIHVKNEKIDGHSIYTADIKLKDASFMRTAFAKDKVGDYRDHTSVMAKQNNAILAINGDFYGFRNTGIIIRGGTLYRDKPRNDMAALKSDGSLLVMAEKEADSAQLLKDGVKETWSFGPWLMKDSVTRTDFSSSNIKPANPRAGIGMIEPNHFIFMVVDGRSKESRGMTLTEFAQAFEKTGCVQAYNLDGGGSATLYFNGRVVNNPLGTGIERSVSDIIYIAKAE